MSYGPEVIGGYSSDGRALRGMQEATVESPVRFRVSSQIKTIVKMRKEKKRKTGLEKEAGCVLLETASMLMRRVNTIENLMESIEVCSTDESFEKAVTYQALKKGAEGMQRTLDEMNDVLEKFGYKE